MVRKFERMCAPALVALALLSAVQVSAQTPVLRLFGGDGHDSGVPKSCGANPNVPCVLDVKVTINGGNGKCTVQLIDRPQVLRGQTLKWQIVTSDTTLEFDEDLGIAIAGNNVPGTSAGTRPYFHQCNKSSAKTFECKRKQGGGGNDDENQINRLAYGVNMIYVHNNQRRLCYVDPLIISRD